MRVHPFNHYTNASYLQDGGHERLECRRVVAQEDEAGEVVVERRPLPRVAGDGEEGELHVGVVLEEVPVKVK
jgi:hypothetical protein